MALDMKVQSKFNNLHTPCTLSPPSSPLLFLHLSQIGWPVANPVTSGTNTWSPSLVCHHTGQRKGKLPHSRPPLYASLHFVIVFPNRKCYVNQVIIHDWHPVGRLWVNLHLTFIFDHGTKGAFRGYACFVAETEAITAFPQTGVPMPGKRVPTSSHWPCGEWPFHQIVWENWHGQWGIGIQDGPKIRDSNLPTQILCSPKVGNENKLPIQSDENKQRFRY